MKTIINPKKRLTIRANAGDELGLLVNLLREEKIGYKTLLRNVAEIVADDYDLVVKAVLILTDKNRIKAAELTQFQYEDALVAVRTAAPFKGKDTVIAAIADTMQAEW